MEVHLAAKQMQKNFKRPENFQDFESLCKHLWSAECKRNFQKNGRTGQSQMGVDIYGVPEGKDYYLGIQCKLKTDGKHLTLEEIQSEVTEAKSFEPGLKELIIATTDVKDAKLEAEVRKLNIENLKSNLFSIQLYCWPEIEDMLRAHRTARDWYDKEMNMVNGHNIMVCFKNQEDQIVISPHRVEEILHYKYQAISENEKLVRDAFKKIELFHNQFSQSSMFDRDQPFGYPENNKAWCKVDIIIHNIGDEALEDWELNLELNCNEATFWEPSYLFDSPERRWLTIWSNEITYRNPENRKFVQNTSYIISFYIRPEIGVSSFVIKWHLTAVDFVRSKKLIVNVETKTSVINKTIIVEEPHLARIEHSELKDYYVKETLDKE